MSESKEFKTLLNKYNTLLAKAQDLQEQLKTKNEQWAAMKSRYEIIEKNTRELCEAILAKDKKEMVLGKDYSWDQVKIEDLLIKTKKAYHDYNNHRKEVMQKIFDVSEQRRETIEGLEAQISRMMQNGAQNVTMEDIHKEIEKEKKEEEAKKHAPNEMKKAVEENRVQIAIEDEDDFESASIWEKVDEKNEKMRTSPKLKKVPKKPTPNAPEIHRDEENHEKAKLERRKKTSPYIMDLKNLENKMDENMWMIIQVMGDTGKSLHLEIKEEIIRRNATMSNTAITNGLNSLMTYSVIKSEKFSLPLSGTTMVSCLDTLGIRLYETRYNKKPEKSEVECMIAEHTTAMHGYGIKAVAEKMIKAGTYKSVEYMNNRNHPIMIGEGVTYIPDITTQDRNGVRSYFEYELGHHEQRDFNAKCSKMMQVTEILNFIVPNANVLSHLCDQVEKWIVNKGANALSGITIRVVAVKQMQDDMTENIKWKAVYEPGKTGTNPTINF